ncbi:hypothetical protein L3Q82_026858 [Scortum barcoo]|uniref:Uncharacterized protein n=1 Tax=Scortum barcoo TaxID=214431 RepID=A0ACB8WK49_9TELE|nr:hypothetical protein L3Q82_026858 [Scortum barcoo]
MTSLEFRPRCHGDPTHAKVVLYCNGKRPKLSRVESSRAEQDTLGQRSMIDFVFVSSDLRPYVLDTRVKRGAELVNRSPPGEPRWWTPEVRDAVRLKKESYRTMLACGTPDAVDRVPAGQASKLQPGRSWRQKLGSGRSSLRPWKEDYRSVGLEEILTSKPSGAPQKGEAVLCQDCLQCRWGAVDLDWGHCRTVEEILRGGSPQSHRLAFQ